MVGIFMVSFVKRRPQQRGKMSAVVEVVEQRLFHVRGEPGPPGGPGSSEEPKHFGFQ
jgi:hypothetical protein